MRRAAITAVFVLLCGCSNKTDTLYQAISRGSLPEVQALVESGVDVNTTIGEGDQRVTPLIAALVLQKEEIATYLTSRGADVRQFSHFYSTEDYARHLYPSGSPALKAILNKKVAK